MKPIFDISRRSLYLVALITVSGLLAFLHLGPLNGTFTGLIFVILTHLYLPGWLLLRFLRLPINSNWVVRFAWILLAGLALTITLGGIFRLLQISVPVYEGALIILMIALTILRLPAKQKKQVGETQVSEPLPKTPYQRVFIYCLLVLCSGIALYVGIAVSQQRTSGWEDQTVFISLADWLAHNPDDPALLSRQISGEILDGRWVTDGWTYNHANWVWSSGNTATNLIWYDLTPLFSWTIPLVIFALIFELSKRETTAVYAVAGLTLASLITLDSLVYTPTYIAYGQNVFTYLNTLRQFSTAIMLPLTQMVCLSYIQNANHRKLPLVGLAAIALAFLHPRQIVILYITIGIFALIYWILDRSRHRFFTAALLLMVILPTLIVPYAQRKLLEAENPRVAAVLNQASSSINSKINLPPHVVKVGNSLIINPSTIFYHPIIIVAVFVAALLLLPMIRLKRPEIIFVCGATAAILFLLLTPVITDLFLRVVSIHLAPGFIIAIPIGLTLGIGFDYLISQLRQYAFWGIILTAAMLIVIAFKPITIPSSAQDQIHAFNQMQSLRNILPADQALLNLFETNSDLHFSQRTVILTPNRIANYIVESVPNSFVTGGRANGAEEGVAGVTRFFNEAEPIAPFLDTFDLEYLQKWHISYIVTEAKHTRTAQLLMRPERFRLLAQTSGYLIFQVMNNTPDTGDALFAQMNNLYPYPRYDLNNGFRLDQPILAEWQEIADAWIALRAKNENSAVHYGLAFSLLMIGREQDALPLWQGLFDENPENPLIVTALVHTLLRLGQTDQAKTLLHKTLISSNDGLRTIIAEQFLRPSILYQLDDTLIHDMMNAASSAPSAWTLLAQYDQPNNVRLRSALLISRGFYSEANRELATLPLPEVGPGDLWTKVSIRLASGDIQGAISILEPYLDGDYSIVARFLHPDRWTDNNVAQMLGVLKDSINTETLQQQFDLQIPKDYKADDPNDHPSLHSIKDMPSNLSLKILHTNFKTSNHLQVRILAGIGANGCPVREWHVIAFNPTDFSRYAEVTQSAVFVEGTLTEWTIEVPLNTTSNPDVVELKVVAVCNPLVQYMPEYTTVQRAGSS